MQHRDVANRFVVAPVLRVTPERVTMYLRVRHVKKRDKLFEEKEREQERAGDKRHFARRRIGDNELIIVLVVEIATKGAIGRLLFPARFEN